MPCIGFDKCQCPAAFIVQCFLDPERVHTPGHFEKEELICKKHLRKHLIDRHGAAPDSSLDSILDKIESGVLSTETF